MNSKRHILVLGAGSAGKQHARNFRELGCQVSVFDPRSAASPCYRCLYEESGELDTGCSTNGVLAPLVGIVGSIQATECLKLLAGVGSTLVGRLLLIDALTMQFRELQLKRNPACDRHSPQ